jgi:DNA-binding CsgD family transcriptional regulator
LKTIANQKTSIFKKLGIKNTDELFAVFRDWRKVRTGFILARHMWD